MYSINAGFNNITALPLELANLGELVTLDVSYNRISTLPLAFGQMFRRDKKGALEDGGTRIKVFLQGNVFNAVPSTVWEWGGPISDLDTAKPLMVDVNMSDNNISFFHHMGATAPLASAATITTSVSSILPMGLNLNHNPVCNSTTGVVPREFVAPGWRVTCSPTCPAGEGVKAGTSAADAHCAPCAPGTYSTDTFSATCTENTCQEGKYLASASNAKQICMART